MEGNGYDKRPQAPKGARVAFGILMIIIYVGVGALFIFNVFDIINYTVSCIVGVLLVIYGIFRAYRLYKGVN